MLKRFSFISLSVLVICLLAVPVQALDLTAGLKTGSLELTSAGPISFGPQGILFVGDTKAAQICAIDTGDTKGDPEAVRVNVKGLNQVIAALLGTEASDLLINDVAVNPASGKVYISASAGRGPGAKPVLLRVDATGKVAVVSLKKVHFATTKLPNPPAPGGTGRRDKRSQSITDIAYIDGRIIVAGLSNEEFASTLRSIPFPFAPTISDGTSSVILTQGNGTSIEIYHGAHGKFETRSPIRTFATYLIDKQPHVVAAYTCTPLVTFPLSKLKPGEKFKGTTIAELGNRNRPLDMFVYTKKGKDYILMANSARGVMKISTDKIGQQKAITNRVASGKTAGQSYDTIDRLKGILQLDRLNSSHAVVLVQGDSGSIDLSTVELP